MLLGLSGVDRDRRSGFGCTRPVHALRGWLFIVGQFLFFAGDLYTYSYPKLFGAEVEFPSLGDGVYLAVYPVSMAGLLILVRRRNPRRRPGRRHRRADHHHRHRPAFVGVPRRPEHPSLRVSRCWRKAVSAAYPLGDILLLAAAIRLAVDTGKRAPPSALLVAASSPCSPRTPPTRTHCSRRPTTTSSAMTWVGLLYYLLWGAAALHPSMRTLDEPALDIRARLTPFALGCSGSLPDRARNSLLAGGRQPRRARAHHRLCGPVRARRHAHGRAGAPGGTYCPA